MKVRLAPFDMIKKKLGTAKRFGARYGTRSKEKVGKIEAESRKRHKCPYCHKIAVKRIAYGIWQCRKCSSKFTGKAYSVEKKIQFEEEIPEVKEVQNG